jgi:hypothetical protein
MKIRCSICNGNGITQYPRQNPQQCEDCDGRGKVEKHKFCPQCGMDFIVHSDYGCNFRFVEGQWMPLDEARKRPTGAVQASGAASTGNQDSESDVKEYETEHILPNGQRMITGPGYSRFPERDHKSVGCPVLFCNTCTAIRRLREPNLPSSSELDAIGNI